MKLAIAGCSGRMGQTLIKAAAADKRFTLAIGSERPGFDKAAFDFPVVSDPAMLAEKADAVIDFTSPEATLAVAEAVAKKGGIHIVGTTGFSAAEQKKLETFSKQARIVQSGNFSLGVNLLERLVEQAAKILGEEYDIEISEMHHKHKKDAPSGTALMLGRASARGRNADFDKKKVINREGARKAGDIGFTSLRGGDVVGIHEVIFAGPGETLTLSHQGFSRDIYAAGALAAALWAHGQKPGLYSMRDVLGL